MLWLWGAMRDRALHPALLMLTTSFPFPRLSFFPYPHNPTQGHPKVRWSHTWYLAILYWIGAVIRYGCVV